jgi:hypothetical protein
MISLLLKNIWLYFKKKYFTFIEQGPNAIDEKSSDLMYLYFSLRNG